MPITTRPLIRASRLGSLMRQPQAPRVFYSGGSNLPGGTPGEASEQAVPLGLYYEAVLNRPQPIPDVKPEEPPTSSPKSPRSTPATAQEKARIIFGSRLAGPAERAERLEAIRNRSTLIAGVLVPPRPEEPDNCCMSGCVNCVWDRYRDEMEEWVSASAMAEKALQAQQSQQGKPSKEVPSAAKVTEGGPSRPTSATSMDDDGGGSEANWQPDLKMADGPKIAKDFWDDDLYKDVPVGIREFMKQEKRLKEKHIREGTFGA
ncbi:oxidoreductase-like protein [Daldinia vernicosa]|uniref:oxidoreductase-like protein n=1 Tax=Daldinia vernicosa TaxID=114800 RepID=UPI002007A773|nr:oxidoreductase-like protein [Daldinia vernicosa]KAI0844227.1 oxidoreductase-like protein [Daldinia vernicosa]